MIEKIYAFSKEKKILKKYAFLPPLIATKPLNVPKEILYSNKSSLLVV